MVIQASIAFLTFLINFLPPSWTHKTTLTKILILKIRRDQKISN